MKILVNSFSVWLSAFLENILFPDRMRLIEELKAQGKLREENLTVNKTNNTEVVTESIGTVDDQEENQTISKENDTGTTEKTKTAEGQERNYSSTQKLNSISFISLIWVLAMLLSAVIYVRK